MGSREIILGVDIGTTATKVSFFNLKGESISSATEEYTLLTEKTLHVEVKIETLWDSFIAGVKRALSSSQLDSKRVVAIGISAQGETFVPLDKNCMPLRNAIVWLDGRAEEESEILSREFNDKASYEITGQVKMMPTWPASKILWIRRHEPDIFRLVSKYLLVEDYFIWKMTGAFVSEGSLLCSTCYWNILTKKWWHEMLDYLSISSDQLPEIREPGEQVGKLTTAAAKDLGLEKETVVTTGALDQVCGTIGVGNIRSGIFTENIGAALAICSTLSKPVFDRKRRMPIHYHGIPNTYMAHTFTTGGMALRWFRDTFYGSETRAANRARTNAYRMIDDEVSEVPPASAGLITLPHLQGAMAPEANPKARGVFYGFTLSHSRPYFARSVMEAIACIVRRNIDVLKNMGIEVEEIRALGGGARSNVWNQIVADLTKKPVVTTTHDEDASCLGAALLAAKGAGLFPRLDDAVRNVIMEKMRFNPNSSRFRIYDDLYGRYVKLYESLVGLFEAG